MEKNTLAEQFKKDDKVEYIPTGEKGIVTSTNQYFVFVKYSKNGIIQATSNATNPRDLKLIN